MKNNEMIFTRINTELKRDFQKCLEENGDNMSSFLRRKVTEYVKENAGEGVKKNEKKIKVTVHK